MDHNYVVSNFCKLKKSYRSRLQMRLVGFVCTALFFRAQVQLQTEAAWRDSCCPAQLGRLLEQDTSPSE